MYVIGWSLTSRCNMHCKHCYNASGKPHPNELTDKGALQAAREIVRMGVDKGEEVSVNFGGGECPLRQDFIPICKELHDNGVKISLTTNGTTFPLIEPNLDLFYDIGVSIDFPEPERHDCFRGGNGTFDKAVGAIKELVSRGVENEVVTCINRMNSNKECLKGIYDLSRELGVDSWRLNRYRETGRGLKNNDELALSPQLLKEAYIYLSTLSTKKALNPDPLYRNLVGGKTSQFGCPCGKTSCRIQPDGEVSPCIFLKESGGNVLDKRLADIFDSCIFKKMRDRQPKGKCVGCVHYDYCEGGCAGAAYLSTGDFNSPDPLCWFNPGEQKERKSVAMAAKGEVHIHELYLGTVYVTF